MSAFRVKPAAVLVSVALILCAWIVPVKADGLILGVKADYTTLFTEGFEENADGAIKETVDHTEEAAIPSIFVEYTYGKTGNIGDGWIIGLDYIPIKAELGSETDSKIDLTKSNNVEGDKPLVTQVKEVDLQHHTTLYIETPGFAGGFYGKAGVGGTRLRTKETLGTGSRYPDDTIFLATVGLGFKRYFGNIVTKVEGHYTAYETVNLVADSEENGGDTIGAKKITADPQSFGISLAFGYAF